MQIEMKLYTSCVSQLTSIVYSYKTICTLLSTTPLYLGSLGIGLFPRDRRLFKPDVVDCNGKEVFTGDADTSRHTGVLDPTVQVRTPDVAVVPMEISS